MGFFSGLEVAEATLGCGHGEEKKLDVGRTQGFGERALSGI